MTELAKGAAQIKRLKFRELLARKKMTVMPGGFSPLYARMAQEIGFESFFLAGSQLSAFLYGVPDNGIIGLRDLVDHARHMAQRSDIPIFVDADTGFGNAVNVHYSVQEIIWSGVAGLQIEDQEAPKKSGTVAGRRCISLDEAVGKIRAATAARDEIDPAFVICARTDILGAENGSFDEALRRCTAYIKDGGADFIWLNSVQSRDMLKRACAEIPGPVLALWGGQDQPPDLEELERLGVRVALYPVMAATIGMQASWEVLNDFKKRGTAAIHDWDRRAAANPYGTVSVAKLIGMPKIRELEDRFLTDDKKRDYETTWGHKTSYADSQAKRAKRST
jgi:2-methylisocitrate lyase-like PEP mutase family enzyme